jgi:hypothetical protein
MRALAVLAAFGLPVCLPAAEPEEPAIRFQEVSEAAGLGGLVHSTRSFGERPKADVLEMFTDGGAAVAVGDFDGDGRDDLFLTESDEGRPNHLLRNVTGEAGELRFEEVTEAAGVAGGNDAASIVADALWLDYDDDGRLDLLVARFGTPLLWRNDGIAPVSLGPSPPAQGERDASAQPSTSERRVPRFADVSEAAGLTAPANTIAVIAFDADGDGWLDLLFGNYFPDVDLLDLDDPHVLPEDLDDAHNGGGLTLWKNVAKEGAPGGRAFVDVTEEAGLAGHTGWSLDVGHGDLDNDGDPDVYVASDYGTDRLFINRGDGTFGDATERLLGGFDTKKGMNVDMADYDGNGYLDVYVTNITDEYMKECNMLWANLGPDGFLDLSKETGTCDTDWGWGAKFGDFDNDGWVDLFAVAGLRSAGEENYIPVLLEMLITPGVDFSDLHSYPDIGEMTWSGYQPQRLFRNLGDGTFREMAAEAGIDNLLDGRGAGAADFDHDGRLDLVQTNARERVLLHRNVTESPGRWLAVRLRGAGAGARGPDQTGGSNRAGIGARVTVTLAGGRSLFREVDGGNGYAGQSSTEAHFGLGEATWIESIEVRWPSGRVDVVKGEAGAPAVRLDSRVTIAEGKGLE